MRRALVAYDDLPHETPAEVAAPKRRRRAPHGYEGPHWDAPDTSAEPLSAPPALAPWDAPPAGATPTPDPYDTDDAIVASPIEAEPTPFLAQGVDVPVGQRTLTAEDVWDDRFLLDVWHAAEQEYRDFHAQRTAALDVGDSVWHALPRVGAPLPPCPVRALTPHVPPPPTTAWERAQAIVARTPNTIAGRSHDESLQNLAMAWYYAGYYTARYAAAS
ncbi:hypothetical protein MEQU1_001798 [Malassezia equina]|uniref:Uncharacterized protein n=1 Tax=Malassezia equina TaxID=1381935 RepID=A0AAF0EB39_9BASI|nr:hypothetical protein MEQU1_001798 [Malassezia equina]